MPAHERGWRHPSEIGQQAWVRSEPPLAIGRGLTAATGAIGGLLAMAVLWTMLPTQAGRSVVATVRSTIVDRFETGLVTARVNTTTTTAFTPPPSSVPTTQPTTPRVPAPSSIAPLTQLPLPTYQLQQGTDHAQGAVAVAVAGGSLIITTAAAVSADLTVELVKADGTSDTARVLFVDDRSGLAVLAPGSATGIESYVVAGGIDPGDQLTFFGSAQMTLTVAEDSTIADLWADDAAMLEGTPVVNQRGELVALCSHAHGVYRLVELSNLDELQQAIAGTAPAKVWLGITPDDEPSGQLSVGDVDPEGPAAAAGLVGSDVIVTIDDVPVADTTGLAVQLALHVPGDVVRVGVRRADATVVELSLTLGEPKTTM